MEADATALPFGDASAGVAWCLGVLCTAEGPDAQLAMLRELGRIVRPDGRIGLLVYLVTTGQLDDPPQGNHFPSRGQLSALLDGAHLEVLSVADAYSGNASTGARSVKSARALPSPSLRTRSRSTGGLDGAGGGLDELGHLVISAPGAQGPAGAHRQFAPARGDGPPGAQGTRHGFRRLRSGIAAWPVPR